VLFGGLKSSSCGLDGCGRWRSSGCRYGKSGKGVTTLAMLRRRRTMKNFIVADSFFLEWRRERLRRKIKANGLKGACLSLSGTLVRTKT
jgi:hypothetical protein